MRSFRKKQQIRIWIVRIIALTIAILMVLGAVITAVVSVSAVDEAVNTFVAVNRTETQAPKETEPENEIPNPDIKLYGTDDFLLRVGVMYSDDCADSHALYTSHAQLGYQLFATKGTELSYIWQLDNAKVSFCADGNLEKSGSGADIVYNRSSSGTIGGYHLLLEGAYTNISRVQSLIAEYSKKTDVLIFPCYENGSYVIKCGSYTSSDAAATDAGKISEALGVPCKAIGYTSTGIKILNYNDGRILFGFDNGSQYGIGAYPIKDGTQDNFLELDPDRGTRFYRAGVFEFKHSVSSDYQGLSVVMITEIDEYIVGVIPWEIYPSWPIEIMKSMAVTIRSYTYGHLSKHSKYGFDICTTSCCQNHKGHGRVNQRVKDAVAQTTDLVLTCNGEMVSAYYHDLSGGSIAAGHEVWNQAELPYLQGMMTPWENLDPNVRTYAYWEYYATPQEVCKLLNSNGYTTLKDKIVDIKITQCTNSTYAYSVLITDVHGTQVRITRVRNVRNAFNKYLHSGNFTVNKIGGTDTPDLPESITGVYVMTSDGLKYINGEKELNIQTALGVVTSSMPEALNVKTSASMVTCNVMDEVKAFVNSSTASSSSDFTEFQFVGSGNGHGVGMSQSGSFDLCNEGKKYDEILYTYFPKTKVVKYEDFKK